MVCGCAPLSRGSSHKGTDTTHHGCNKVVDHRQSHREPPQIALGDVQSPITLKTARELPICRNRVAQAREKQLPALTEKLVAKLRKVEQVG